MRAKQKVLKTQISLQKEVTKKVVIKAIITNLYKAKTAPQAPKLRQIIILHFDHKEQMLPRTP
jgi:hypothetical protein